MEIYNEESFYTDVSKHTSRFDPALLEPPAMKPPFMPPKSATCEFSDLDPIHYSVTSDVSEFDAAFYPNNVQNVSRNYPSPIKYNEISSPRTFSHFNPDPVPSVRPKIKNQVGGVVEPALDNLQQNAGISYNSHIPTLNGASLQPNRQNFISSKLNQCNNSLRNCVFDKNGEFTPEFQMQNLNPHLSSRQNAICASGNFDNGLSPFEPQSVANLLNKSDSVILLPEQLQFQESNSDENEYLNVGKHMRDVSMQSQAKFRKHPSFDGSRDAQSVVSTNRDLNQMGMNAEDSVQNQIWVLLREQNKKIKELQNQLSAIQLQNAKSETKQETEEHISDSKQFDKINDKLNCILESIRTNDTSILTLKDEVSILAKRTEALELKSKNSEPLNASISCTPSNTAANVASSKSNDVLCCRETHVKKTSSSTMTSISFEGKEKLLFQKTTVVTENCQQGLVLRNSQNKSPSLDNAAMNKSHNCSGDVAANRSSKSTTPKSLDTKMKSKKADKSNCDCENLVPIGDLLSSAVKHRTSNHNKASPLSDTNHEIKERKNRESPRERNGPNYDRIVRNINNLVLREDDENESTEKDHCSGPCCNASNNTPRTGASSAKRKSKTLKNSDVSPSTSEESDYAGAGWNNAGAAYRRNLNNSPKSKYGIPSALMSVDTQQYLEKHRLCDNNGKWSSKKSKAPHSKRQLR